MLIILLVKYWCGVQKCFCFNKTIKTFRFHWDFCDQLHINGLSVHFHFVCLYKLICNLIFIHFRYCIKACFTDFSRDFGCWSAMLCKIFSFIWNRICTWKQRTSCIVILKEIYQLKEYVTHWDIYLWSGVFHNIAVTYLL
jgi:hypothetical protein